MVKSCKVEREGQIVKYIYKLITEPPPLIVDHLPVLGETKRLNPYPRRKPRCKAMHSVNDVRSSDQLVIVGERVGEIRAVHGSSF